MLVIAVLINGHYLAIDRLRHMADHARLAAASVDLKLGQLLELTSFCATSPALIDRVDFHSVAESCGRYASRIGAWVVIFEIGETHRQILNTRPDAPAVLPSYPRDNEHPTLLALEERSRASGKPGIADVFTGIILPEGVISAGQYLRLADGRDAMLYVSVAARTLSDQLAGLAVQEDPIFGLIDPSRRVVARSVGIERAMFADAPDWILGFLETGAAGASLGVPGPDVIGGTWDAGYQPLSVVPGWMTYAVQPAPVATHLWTPFSMPTAVAVVGLVLSSLLMWGLSARDRAARRVEAAQRAEAEAKRQNQQKSQLLASFAHDIRSPLISLIGSLEMVGEERDTAAESVQTARASAEALLQFVDDILELSFLGSGEMSFHSSPVDLRELAMTLSDQTRRLAERKGLAIRLELDPILPSVVEVDRLRLQQVLSNLLTNAVKYTERGTVTLQFRVAEKTSEHVDLDLAVVDTGIGLAAEDIPRILREFGRLEREAERRETGSGLGLAIAQRILQGMGTTLSVESVPGQGSTFRFRLALPVPTDELIMNATRPLSDIVILYAEDEPVIRQVTARRLEEAGACVVCATDGEDVLSQIENLVPDLLLIDLQMPGLDGVDLIHRLKSIAPDRAYPIFVLTSHISGNEAAKARASGANAVFTKPVQVAALAAAFRARRGDTGKSTPMTGSTQERSDAPLLDLNTFRDLLNSADPEAVAALIDKFERTMTKDLVELQAGIDVGDVILSRELAHRALGVCLVLGASNLAMRLRSVEEAAVGDATAFPRELMDGWEGLLASTVVAMRSVFPLRLAE